MPDAEPRRLQGRVKVLDFLRRHLDDAHTDRDVNALKAPALFISLLALLEYPGAAFTNLCGAGDLDSLDAVPAGELGMDSGRDVFVHGDILDLPSALR